MMMMMMMMMISGKVEVGGLRPCYIVQFSQQLVSQCRCETKLPEQLHSVTWVVSYEVALSSTFRN